MLILRDFCLKNFLRSLPQRLIEGIWTELTEEEIEAVFQLTGDTLLSNYFGLHLDNVYIFTHLN